MYATINLPGSTHFHWHGPATRQACEAWLDRTVQRLLRTELLSSTMPRRVISNKEARTWRWRDGSRIFPPDAHSHTQGATQI
jgi:hypothetical protein